MKNFEFETGKNYSGTFITNSDSRFEFTIIKRTEKCVWIQDINDKNAKPKRKKIHQSSPRKDINGQEYKYEYCEPYGNYSMSPLLCADDVVETDIEDINEYSVSENTNEPSVHEALSAETPMITNGKADDYEIDERTLNHIKGLSDIVLMTAQQAGIQKHEIKDNIEGLLMAALAYEENFLKKVRNDYMDNKTAYSEYFYNILQ